MLEAIAAHKEIGLAAAALSSVFWTLTYALILRRAARDRSYGMPLPALGANLAWEITFLVVTLRRDPLDARLALLVPWTLLDFGLVAQCLRYGRREATHPLVQRHYPIF